MNTLKLVLLSNVRSITRRALSYDVYEPDYLDALKPKVPLYDTIDVEIRGHDYAVLENYQSLIHRLAKNLDIDVEEGWAVPAQQMQITTFKPKSGVINSQYNLNTYKRTIQLSDVFTTQLPILIRALEASTPAGVQLNVFKHEIHHDEERYVPDKDLLTLKEELDNMANAKKSK